MLYYLNVYLLHYFNIQAPIQQQQYHQYNNPYKRNQLNINNIQEVQQLIANEQTHDICLDNESNTTNNEVIGRHSSTASDNVS